MITLIYQKILRAHEPRKQARSTLQYSTTILLFFMPSPLPVPKAQLSPEAFFQARSTLEHSNSFFFYAFALAQGSTFSRSLLSLLFPSLIPISL
jgi:hypothetical protein